MFLEPAEHLLVLAGLDPVGPEAAVVPVAAEPGHADADGVLRPADEAAAALRVVLEAEHQLGQHLRVHVRQLVGPDLLDHVAGAGAKAAALAYLEGRLEADGDGPAGGVLAHVGLVDPGAGQVEARGNLALGLLEGSAAAGCEALLGHALEHHVLDAALLADAALVVVAAVAVDHQDVGLHDVERGHEIQHSAAGVDVGVLHIADALDHEQALLLAIDRLVVLVAEDGGVGAYANVEVAVLRGLAEEFHVAAVEQVVTAGDEDFLCHLYFGDPEAVEVAVLIDGDHGALAGAEFRDCGGGRGVELHHLEAFCRFGDDEGDVVLRGHGVRHAADLDADHAVRDLRDHGDVLLEGAVLGFGIEFGHSFAAAGGHGAAVDEFDNHVAAMLAFEELNGHNQRVFGIYWRIYEKKRLAPLFFL